MTRNAHGFLLRALLCFSCMAGIALTGCSEGGDPVAALLDSSSPTPPSKFISTWTIPSSDLDIQLPLRSGYNYDFTVNWGDGNSSEVEAHDDPDARHIYEAAGDYTITIVGTLEAWYFNNDGDKDKIIAVENFGRMGWKNLNYAFAGCSSLTTFKGGDVSQVTNMGNMFAGASSLEQLDLSNWDVSSVTNMSYMFASANSLEQLDLNNWDVSFVENMSGMFSNASLLEQPDLSNWDFGSVTTMAHIFAGTNNPSTESYSEMLMRIVDTSSKSSIIALDGGLAKYNDCGAKARAELVRRGWTVNDVGPEAGADADNCEWSPQTTFKSTWSIPSLDLDIQLPLRSGYNYDFTVSWGDGSSSKVKAHDDLAASHTYSAAGNYTITIVGTLEAWYFNDDGDKDKIIAVENFGRMGWKKLNYAFADCSNLTTFKGGDVSQVTDMGHMFAGASSLEELNTSNWNVSSVENMTSMFNNASSLAQLGLNNWDVSSVEDMSSMFRNASSLKQLDTINNWDVSSVTNMRAMFYSASSLKQLDLSNWDVSSVEDMSLMFYNASSLNQLDLSNWDVSSVENMIDMFASASSLNQLDTINNWDVSSVEDMSYMFNNASSLEQLNLSNWDFGSVTTMESIFAGASELTTESYSEMLMRIVDTSTSQEPITLGGGPAKYNDCGAKAKAILTTAPRSWTITDGGPQDGGADAARCTEWNP